MTCDLYIYEAWDVWAAEDAHNADDIGAFPDPGYSLAWTGGPLDPGESFDFEMEIPEQEDHFLVGMVVTCSGADAGERVEFAYGPDAAESSLGAGSLDLGSLDFGGSLSDLLGN